MKGNDRDALRAQMDDLVTGQLSPRAAWWLRRRIARDPELAREWEEVRALRAGMKTLVARFQTGHLPAWGTTSAQPSGARVRPTPRRRAMVIASLGLALVVASGAAAIRYRMLDLYDAIYFEDSAGHPWQIRTAVKGTVLFINPDGRPIAHLDSEGAGPSQTTMLTTPGHQTFTFHGYGSYPVRSAHDDLLGFVKITPFTPEKARQKAREIERLNEVERQLYQRPEMVVRSDEDGQDIYNDRPSDYRPGDSTSSNIGLIGGVLREQGVSWKLVGYARVTGVCYRNGKRKTQAGTTSSPPDATVVRHPETLEMLPPEVRQNMMKLLKVVPAAGAPPILYWQIAGRNTESLGDHAQAYYGYAIRNHRWTKVERSGSFTGYGRHQVKAEDGNLLLNFDIRPLKIPAPSR